MSVVDKSSAYPDTVQPGLPRLGKKPPGWTRLRMSELLYEERRPVDLLDDATYDLVTVKRARGGVVKRDTKRGADISVKTQFRVNDGDFLISKRQIVHGACGIVPPELDGSTVSNEYSVLRSKGGIDLDYLKYLSHSVYFQQTCFHSSIGVHIEKMIFKTDKWLEWEFDLPPLEEQHRIVRALSAWDQAISNTERLAANSEKQMDFVANGLLRGEARLPRFGGDWPTRSLISLADPEQHHSFIDGDWIESPHIRPSGIRLIQTGNIGVGRFKDSAKRYISEESFLELKCKAVLPGDILICRLADPAGRSCIAPTMLGRAITSVDVTIFRPDPRHVDRRFLVYLMNRDAFLAETLARCGGSTRTRISRSALGELTVRLPSKEEQTAIADTLAPFEDYGITLGRKLAVLRQEKAALLQQLLTGKRRFSTKKEAA
jgi:type I restriction enzyme S subunit